MNAFRHIALIALAAAPLAHAAQAQALRDPTRPPNAALVSANVASLPADGTSQRLESILISPTRRVAIIDGRTVSVGSKVDDGTVVEIAESHVLLRQGAEVKRLPLYPGIERKPSRKENRP